MSDEALILVEHQGPVAWLRLNLPQRLNPLARPLQEQFRTALPALRNDTSVRALVVTGTDVCGTSTTGANVAGSGAAVATVGMPRRAGGATTV